MMTLIGESVRSDCCALELYRGEKGCCTQCLWCLMCHVVCYGSCYGARIRKELRYKYLLEETPCSDCFVHFLYSSHDHCWLIFCLLDVLVVHFVKKQES